VLVVVAFPAALGADKSLHRPLVLEHAGEVRPRSRPVRDGPVRITPLQGS